MSRADASIILIIVDWTTALSTEHATVVRFIVGGTAASVWQVVSVPAAIVTVRED